MYTKRGISDVEIFDSNVFTEKYQINTNQYIEYLALKGDKSDNIPGLSKHDTLSLVDDFEAIDLSHFASILLEGSISSF